MGDIAATTWTLRGRTDRERAEYACNSCSDVGRLRRDEITDVTKSGSHCKKWEKPTKEEECPTWSHCRVICPHISTDVELRHLTGRRVNNAEGGSKSTATSGPQKTTTEDDTADRVKQRNRLILNVTGTLVAKDHRRQQNESKANEDNSRAT